MDFEKKDSFSYLDGVPFRIGTKFCPPRSVQLPFACAPLFPLDLLEEEYDFSLEKEVLESAEAAKLTENTEALAGNGASNFSFQLSPVKSENLETQADLNSSTLPTNFGASSWPSSSILQPQFQSQYKNAENGSQSTTKSSSKNINLSDFENDTPSPFDYMELQIINDLEELNNVFQGLSGSKPKVFPEGDRSCVYSLCNTSLPSLNSHSETKEQTLTNFSKSVSFPLHQESRFLNSENHHSSTGTVSCDPSNANTLDTNSRNMNGCSQQSCSFPGIGSLPNFYHEVGEQQEANAIVFKGKDSVSFSALSQVPLPTSVSSTATVGSVDFLSHGCSSSQQGKGSGSLRSSKSVSDLLSLPQLEDNNSFHTSARSHTPPPNMVNQVLENEKGLIKDLPCSNASSASPSLSDPYFELEDNERQFVDSVTDMGFPRGQVARTVKHLGTDEKKVVEHLCQIQTLEESGYDSLEAEAALHLHDYNSEEARKYLDLLIKIQGLGFERTAIKKALVQNKNDMNKAINSLLS